MIFCYCEKRRAYFFIFKGEIYYGAPFSRMLEALGSGRYPTYQEIGYNIKSLELGVLAEDDIIILYPKEIGIGTRFKFFESRFHFLQRNREKFILCKDVINLDGELHPDIKFHVQLSKVLDKKWYKPQSQ